MIRGQMRLGFSRQFRSLGNLTLRHPIQNRLLHYLKDGIALWQRMPGEMLDYGRVLTVLKQGVALDGAARTKTTGKI